jgi:ORF6N domain
MNHPPSPKHPYLAQVKFIPLDRRIITIRERRIILDTDLAELYGVTTKALNQAVKRNLERVPPDFSFLLSRQEKAEVVTICDHLARLKFSPVMPRAFTEHGALMVANLLNSPRAVSMSLYLIRAFVKMREDLAANAAILKRLAEIDKTLLLHDKALRDIYQKLRPFLEPPPSPPKPGIGFHVREDAVPYWVKRQPARTA